MDIEFYKKGLIKERKTKALFTLTMPKNNSWNGHWSGEGRCFCKELMPERADKILRAAKTTRKK